jgi:predicted RNase H-like HicB family nuclease
VADDLLGAAVGNVDALSEGMRDRPSEGEYYHVLMLRYHVAFSLPHAPGEMVVAEALDFPGAVTQGFDLTDARLMIAGALEDLAEAMLEESKPLPVPSENAHSTDADLIELVPLSVYAGIAPRWSGTNYWTTSAVTDAAFHGRAGVIRSSLTR